MEKNSLVYQTYLRILERELVPAMGCTEPIALAYCAALARSVLGTVPEKMVVAVSGNILKNVKSVVVPNTEGRRGIVAAVAVGALCGDETAELEVISRVSTEDKLRLGAYLETLSVEVIPADTEYVLDITVTACAGEHSARVRAVNEHTNIVLVEKDGVVLEEKAIETAEVSDEDLPDYSLLRIEEIVDFASGCDLRDVAPIIARQIDMNTAIAEEGLAGDYGANIGKVLLKAYGDDVRVRAKARAAAGSDARMNGCEMPVIINSGSGNQGLTVSLPVIEYAKELNVSRDQLYRALLVSNLVTLHEKTGIGRLSAYCGAVSAGAGAGAGIAYLNGADVETISQTVVNALAITSGIVCDGAKSSCAAKIAAAVDAGILGYEMCCSGQKFFGGEGLVLDSAEESIENFGHLGRIAMKETDREIIRMMTASC
ncbi:MAG: serine dehydratase subunit alpha family protein [Oscillospiraceae bacterium]|nr:serine dehydratase subunit alpha family protein [Oscillospiraceae bacterium]